MGYSPNRAARQLRRQRTDTIGYIIPAANTGFADPFFSEFIAGLGDEAAAHHYDLLVTTAPPASPEERALYQRWVQSNKVDGIVVNRVYFDDWRLSYLDQHAIPHVSLERSPSHANFTGVEVDSYHGIAQLMDYLIKQGHRRIAYIGGNPELKIDHDRYGGYLAGLRAASITPDLALVTHADLTPQGGYQAAGELLDLAVTPTALVCINDQIAIGAMHAAHERGFTIGQDIAVSGFDGVADAAYTQPPLTTLGQPVYAIARQLIAMLMALINGKELAERQVKVQPTLIIRQSTGN
jgi:DNA-binding LacI/PurR family transcriptional regulator